MKIGYEKDFEIIVLVVGQSAVCADIVLSARHISTHSAIMQIYADLLGICPPGDIKAWTHQGIVVRYTEAVEMPSMGRQRL